MTNNLYRIRPSAVCKIIVNIGIFMINFSTELERVNPFLLRRYFKTYFYCLNNFFAFLVLPAILTWYELYPRESNSQIKIQLQNVDKYTVCYQRCKVLQYIVIGRGANSSLPEGAPAKEAQ